MKNLIGASSNTNETLTFSGSNKPSTIPTTMKHIIPFTPSNNWLSKAARGLAVAGLLAIGLQACTDAPEVEQKRAKLSALKEQQIALTAEIEKLQNEVAALSPEVVADLKVIPVVTQPIELSSLKHYIQVQGVVEAENNIMVNARQGGVVTKVYAKVGQIVQAGQLLAETDAGTLAEAIKEVNTQLELAKTLYDKQKALWDQKIGSEVQYLNAKTNLESLQSRLATLNSQRNMVRVTAPMGGVIDEVRVKEGEMAAPGMGLFRLVNLNDLKVTARLADSYISSVKVGSKVNIVLPDIKEELEGTVKFVSRAVDANSRSFQIEIGIPASEKYRPNMFAVVKVNDRTLDNAIVIEENIVQPTDQGDLVYVAVNEGGKTVAKTRRVSKGLRYNGKVEITAGLAAGDQLITTGYQDLVDDQPLSIAQPLAGK